MDNFLYAVQALGLSIKSTTTAIIYHPVVLGFLIGFSASIGIHLIVMSNNPRNIPHILTNSAPQSFLKTTQRNETGTITQSYSSFLREYHRVRVIFYSAALMFLIVIALALTKL